MDAGAEWSDFESQASALDNASTQDCATACKALESLARAAQHICDVSPGECDAAKTRLKSASVRVHAACPSCEVRAGTAGAGAPTSDSHVEVVAQASPEHGGCAGCAMSATHTDLGATAFALALLAGIGRRRRRLDDLRRVRDLRRVESDAD